MLLNHMLYTTYPQIVHKYGCSGLTNTLYATKPVDKFSENSLVSIFKT